MVAPLSADPEYAKEFNAIYPDLEKQFGVAYYPNFLDKISGVAGFTQPDGIHPTREGYSVIVEEMRYPIRRGDEHI